MDIDIYLTVDSETDEVRVLGGSHKLCEAVEAYGAVIAHDVKTNRPFEIYKDGASLKAREITITG